MHQRTPSKKSQLRTIVYILAHAARKTNQTSSWKVAVSVSVLPACAFVNLTLSSSTYVNVHLISNLRRQSCLTSDTIRQLSSSDYLSRLKPCETITACLQQRKTQTHEWHPVKWNNLKTINLHSSGICFDVCTHTCLHSRRALCI